MLRRSAGPVGSDHDRLRPRKPVGAGNSGAAEPVWFGWGAAGERVGSAIVARRRERIAVSLFYWSLRRFLELLVLRRRSEREKEIEILLLRHLAAGAGAPGRSSSTDAG
jgi:hypothetical protein